MNRRCVAVLLIIGLLSFSLRADDPKPDKDGWYDLFDGKSLDDWKGAEDPKAFKVEDGLIVAGPSKLTHLYYAGPVQKANFKNFDRSFPDERLWKRKSAVRPQSTPAKGGPQRFSH
ncbi:MAG: DUF1080 domain-containing protein, partial [Planctomycetes bacterium]|nr:DUF1080 domain-containing protein [Planctomycetota bacterium]